MSRKDKIVQLIKSAEINGSAPTPYAILFILVAVLITNPVFSYYQYNGYIRAEERYRAYVETMTEETCNHKTPIRFYTGNSPVNPCEYGETAL